MSSAVASRSTLRSNRLDGQHTASLLGQLGARLRMRVEQREVGHDDWNRKCYGQYAGERAQRADKHAEVSLWNHVAVADCRHGYNSPPQTHRDGGEVKTGPVNQVKSQDMKITDDWID